jgi:methylglyoxal/glyoxal reductase
MESILDCVTLNNGVMMPRLGFGVFRVPPTETYNAVKAALEVGYRSLDTAKLYGNEEEVWQAFCDSGLKRQDVFITTKLWNSDQGYDNALKAFDLSLKRLGGDYIDLFLIHWPGQNEKRRHEAWDALVKIYHDAKARAIGVSNFTITNLEHLLDHSDVTPAVNQVELHPWLSQKPLIEYCAEREIAVEAWGPLLRGRLAEEPAIAPIAKKYGKTEAQTVLRWHLQNGIIAIPKSVHRERMQENADIFDFTLSPQDMAAIDALNRDIYTGPNPDNMTMDF